MIKSLVATGIALAATVSSASADQLAAAADGVRAYGVVYETDDAASASIVRETLTITTSNGRSYVVVANAAGQAAAFVTTLAPDGEIGVGMTDPAIICYDMMASVVAQHERSPQGPIAVVLSVAGRATPVPLAIKQEAVPSPELVAEGRAGFATVDARVDFQGTAVSDALFQELSIAGSPARVVSRTTCSVGTPTHATTAAGTIQRS